MFPAKADIEPLEFFSGNPPEPSDLSSLESRWQMSASSRFGRRRVSANEILVGIERKLRKRLRDPKDLYIFKYTCEFQDILSRVIPKSFTVLLYGIISLLKSTGGKFDASIFEISLALVIKIGEIFLC